MQAPQFLAKLSLRNTGLYQRLSVAFGALFIVPILGFLYFAIEYGIISDQNMQLFFLVILAFSLLGFILLRTIVDEISQIARSFSQSLKDTVAGDETAVESAATNELKGIVSSFETMNDLFKKNLCVLNHEASKILALKELSNLCYVTFDTDELLQSTLERALAMVQAEAGSILVLERLYQEYFFVQAAIGREEKIRKGDRIPFLTSIAKYAVLNKAPLLVEDIEKDQRFGVHTRFHYEGKSFICMPLKTINEIVGVLTIAKKTGGGTFTQEDVDSLIPLLSNAALSYNNLSLLKKNELLSKVRTSLEKVTRIANSSLRGDEASRAVLREVREIVPFSVALTLLVNNANENSLVIFDALTFIPTTITKGRVLLYADSVVERALGEEKPLIVSNTLELSHPLEQYLFKRQGIRSLMIFPLRFSGKSVGVLALGSSEKNAYSYHEGELIYCLAEQYSSALEKDRLAVLVDQRRREMDTLNQIGNFLAASTFDINRILRYTMDMIGVMMHVEAGSLVLLEKDELVFKVALNSDVNVLRKFRLKLGQGIIGYAAARGEPVIVHDVNSSPHFYAEIDKETGLETRSVLCVPMISQGKVVGAIEVLNKVEGEFDNNDVHLLQSIAASVTIALENARLYRQSVSIAEQERSIRKMFQKFVPKEVVEKIVTVNEEDRMLIGELKTLTFLNIDIRGFSRLSQSLGPQRTVALLNFFFSTMGTIVFQHKGVVDKYLGDGFLAIFGAVKTSIADADNAVAAALEMKDAMAIFNEHVHAQGGDEFSIGISINTGETVIGNIGFEQKMDYTVIGDAVNTVFQIQDVCRQIPNSILMSEKTLRAVQQQPRFRAVDTSMLSTFPEKIRIYEILGR